MKLLNAIVLFLLCSVSSFAQEKNNTVQGIWFGDKRIIDPKVGVITLKRVGHDDMGHGTFIWFKDTAAFSLYYSPMCGNDCIWNYDGEYTLNSKKFTLKFNSYNQHGFCKSMQKNYGNHQMKFTFLVKAKGKDTLVLTRQSK